MDAQESQSALFSQWGPGLRKVEHGRRSLRLAGFLLLAALLAVACDLPVSSWLTDKPLPEVLRKLLSLSEVFAHGLGVGMLLLTVLVLDRRIRHFFPRLVAMSLGAGVLANVVKLLVARERPRAFDGEGSVMDTFTSFLPFFSGTSGDQGFPSAHTATAAGPGRGLGLALPPRALVVRLAGGLSGLPTSGSAGSLSPATWFVARPSVVLGRDSVCEMDGWDACLTVSKIG